MQVNDSWAPDRLHPPELDWTGIENGWMDAGVEKPLQHVTSLFLTAIHLKIGSIFNMGDHIIV